MKSISHYLIIILLITLPFIPISNLLIPHDANLGKEIVSLILIVLATKTIICTILMTLHRSYNSNLDGWLLFSIGLFIMLPLYLEVSELLLNNNNNPILTYLKHGLTVFAITLVFFLLIKTLLKFSTLTSKSIFALLSLVLLYHLWNNITPLNNIVNQSYSGIHGLKSISWQTFMTSLLYFIPISIGLAFVCRGKIRKWKFYTVLGMSFVGILCCIPNIVSNKYILNTVFTSTAASLVPCYWLGIILLTKSAKRLR